MPGLENTRLFIHNPIAAGNPFHELLWYYESTFGRHTNSCVQMVGVLYSTVCDGIGMRFQDCEGRHYELAT